VNSSSALARSRTRRTTSPCGDRLLGGGERGVLGLGDLGVGDQLPGVRVDHRARVPTRVHASSPIPPIAADTAAFLASTTENRNFAFTQAPTTALLP
jgi:hypothetical protein